MFSVEYVYIPLSGCAYICMDYCNALDVCENDDKMTLVFTHRAKNEKREDITFKSSVVIPRQKITVRVTNETRTDC